MSPSELLAINEIVGLQKVAANHIDFADHFLKKKRVVMYCNYKIFI